VSARRWTCVVAFSTVLLCGAAEGSPSRRAADLASAAAELAGFIVNAPLDDASRRRLAAIVAAETARDPAASERTFRSLAEVLRTIRGLRGEAQRAGIRHSIATELYWRSKDRDDPAAQLIFSLAPVVAADPKTRVVVRAADIDGFCRSARLAADAMEVGFDQSSCAASVAETAKRLAELDPADRELMAAGERRAAVLESCWRDLDAERRRAALDAAKARAGSSDPIRLARALETMALGASLDAKLSRHLDAAARGLISGALSSAIGASGRDF
jgi:hypothetical protein